MRPIYTKLF